MATVPSPILCYVTDRRSLAADSTGANLLSTIRNAISAGIDWVQIREKDLPTPELLMVTREAVQAAEACAKTGEMPSTQAVRAKIIVNDRLDVAIAAGADGVHLGRESAPVSEVVRWCRSGNAPPEFLVGASCHRVTEAREAETAGASYAIFGPVFETPSKRVFGPPVGIAQLSAACAAVKIPVLAIGGIDSRNVGECSRAGAAGIAAIRIFQDSRDENELRHVVESLRGDATNFAMR